jgi:hypothetical protein
MKAFDTWVKNKIMKENNDNTEKSTRPIPTISVKEAPPVQPAPKQQTQEEYLVDDEEQEQTTETKNANTEGEPDPADQMVQELFMVVEKYIKIEDYRVIYYNLHYVANQLVNPQTDQNEN